MFKIKEVRNAEEKYNICKNILQELPGWFGIERAIEDYANGVQNMPFYASFVQSMPFGFISINIQTTDTAEIYIMAVMKEFHRQGVGKALFQCCEKFCMDRKISFITVKTMDASHPDENYDKTRAFYIAMGFKPIGVFKTIWDEDNPCLLLAKHLSLK